MATNTEKNVLLLVISCIAIALITNFVIFLNSAAPKTGILQKKENQKFWMKYADEEKHFKVDSITYVRYNPGNQVTFKELPTETLLDLILHIVAVFIILGIFILGFIILLEGF